MKAFRRLSKALLFSLLLTNSIQAHAYMWWMFENATHPRSYEYIQTPEESTMPKAPHTPMQTAPVPVAAPAPVLPTNPNEITRAEFLRVMVNNVYGDELPGNCYSQLSYSNYWLLFTDVPTGASYGRELCAAMTAGWIAGYDNVTFRPNDAIKISEASKIIAKAYGLSYGSSDPSVVWYGPYVEALRSVGGIPDAPLDSPVTPDILGQMLRSVQ